MGLIDVVRGKKVCIDTAPFIYYMEHHELADHASRIRATYHVRTPDAIQASAGILYGADIMITNDSGLKRISEIEVLCLDEFITESD